jgi:hypothetical protein
MPAIKYRVKLTEEEKEGLESLLRKGKSAAHQQTRARILLKAASGSKDAEVMEALDVSATMSYHPRQKSVEEGVEAALKDRPRPGKAAKLDDKQCADRPGLYAGARWAQALDFAPSGRPGRANGGCRVVQPRKRPWAFKKTPRTLAGPGMVYSQGGRRVCRGEGRRT